MTVMATPASAKVASFVVPPNPSLVRIRDLIYQVAGIFQPDNKLRMLEERIARRMQALGVTSLKDYCDHLTIKASHQAEMVNLLNEITIGETCFFRNQPQLDALKTVVLTHILTAPSKAVHRHFRIWSAGCSTGEEPYTLSMMMLEETVGRLRGWSFEIVATDLNERSLAHCKAGSYRDYSTRNLSPYFRQKYFTARGDELCVNPEVRAKVSFSRVNMLDGTRMSALKGMDIILCCNVLIYFDLASKRQVIRHFYENLLPHGYLFLGHSESLYGVNNEFRLVHLPSATAYVKEKK